MAMGVGDAWRRLCMVWQWFAKICVWSGSGLPLPVALLELLFHTLYCREQCRGSFLSADQLWIWENTTDSCKTILRSTCFSPEPQQSHLQYFRIKTYAFGNYSHHCARALLIQSTFILFLRLYPLLCGCIKCVFFKKVYAFQETKPILVFIIGIVSLGAKKLHLD